MFPCLPAPCSGSNQCSHVTGHSFRGPPCIYQHIWAHVFPLTSVPHALASLLLFSLNINPAKFSISVHTDLPIPLSGCIVVNLFNWSPINRHLDSPPSILLQTMPQCIFLGTRHFAWRYKSINTWMWKCLVIRPGHFKIWDVLPNCSPRRSEKVSFAPAPQSYQTALPNILIFASLLYSPCTFNLHFYYCEYNWASSPVSKRHWEFLFFEQSVPIFCPFF